jgi:hypothetical protein
VAGRDGFVAFQLWLPSELRDIVSQYKMDRKSTSLNAAIRELIETHPEIARRVAIMYSGMEGEPPPQGETSGEV